MRIIVTGGAGFIGSALIRYLIKKTNHIVLNIDNLCYAGNLLNLEEVKSLPQYHFAQINICDRDAINKTFLDFEPDCVMHLAAESHVDRSINSSDIFIQTNIIGTHTLLEVSREYWKQLPQIKKSLFRFLHISTDEVFGSLSNTGFFNEDSKYAPNSPYSASKAASDHLVRAWHHTYGLPILITNCSNNYGPYQNPEKLIPKIILNAISGKSIPIYGQGKQIRDWLFVEDHVTALITVLNKGKIGHTYNIGSRNERTNIEIAYLICDILDNCMPETHHSYREQIEFVTDRPGHDYRYAIDSRKICNELKWKPSEPFLSGLNKTVNWYLNNPDWVKRINVF